MSVRVVVLEDGEPVQNLRMRTQDDVEMVSDEQGQLELDLQVGKNELLVFHENSWVSQTITVDETASMVLVDIKENLRISKDKIDPRKSGRISFSDVGRMDLGERYAYDRVLGRGGMSVVIRAKDRLLKRDVAIKLLSDELYENNEAQDIFLTEARNLATLTHPNLVSIHDITKIENRAMMVMEYIRGETIERLMRKFSKGFPEHVGLKLSIQFAKVLGYLHDEGIVHRDIKLANAMVRHDGTLKLIDFGLARRFDTLYIRGTRVRGTPAYMSPEQIKGDSLTPASDIYQLGVCLFEIFTGRLPFEEGEISYAHVHTPPPSPLEFNSDLNPTLANLILYCLKKNPHERPLTAHVVFKQLQNLHTVLDAPNQTEEFFSSTFGSLTNPSMSALQTPGIYETDQHLSQSNIRHPSYHSNSGLGEHTSHPSYNRISQANLNTGEQQMLHPSSPHLAPLPEKSKIGMFVGIGVGLVGICCMAFAVLLVLNKNEARPVVTSSAQPATQIVTPPTKQIAPGGARVVPSTKPTAPTTVGTSPELKQEAPPKEKTATEPPKTDEQQAKEQQVIAPKTPKTTTKSKAAKKTYKRKKTKKPVQPADTTKTETTPKAPPAKTKPANKAKQKSGSDVLFGDEPKKKTKDSSFLPMQ